MSDHVAETFTPTDGAIVVDCSCGTEYRVSIPGATLEWCGQDEATALVSAHARHIEEAGGGE